VRVQTPRGAFGGMLSLGPRPTFGDFSISVEVYLFDTDGDFYGAHVRIELVERLRDVRTFPSAAELVEQIRRDELAARRVLRLPPGRLTASLVVGH